MPYKDLEKRRQSDRERRRRKRAGVVEAVEAQGSQKKLSYPLLSARPTVADLAAAVAHEINRVRAAKVETLTRARCVGYLAGVLLKGLEVGAIEDRLKALEENFLKRNGGPAK